MFPAPGDKRVARIIWTCACKAARQEQSRSTLVHRSNACFHKAAAGGGGGFRFHFLASRPVKNTSALWSEYPDIG